MGAALSIDSFCSGIASGFLWGLDTVILGIALTMGAFIGTPEAIAFAAIASAFMHDAACAIWLFLYMGVRRRLGDTLRALKTRSGKVVMLGALLGGGRRGPHAPLSALLGGARRGSHALLGALLGGARALLGCH